MNLKKRIQTYLTKRLNKKLNQEKVWEYKYFKLANGKFLLKTDADITFDNQVDLLEFISNSIEIQKKVIAKKDEAK